MQRSRSTVSRILVALFSLLTAVLPPHAESAESGKSWKLAVIPKGTTHEFWKSIHAGAIKASRELGVEIVWKGPQKEDDREAQVTVVEDFIARRVDGIVLAPLDDRALVRPVREAVGRKIPVVIMAARLLWDQGLAEFINAAWEIKNKGIPARFLLAGAPDPGNLASASEAELDEWRTEGVVEWSFHP